MKLHLSFFSILFFLAVNCYRGVQAIFPLVVGLAVSTLRIFKIVSQKALSLFAVENDAKSAVVIAFVQAKAFVLRIIKRERPVVSTEWRMCPST